VASAAYAPGSLNAQADGYEGLEVGDLMGAADPDLELVDDRANRGAADLPSAGA